MRIWRPLTAMALVLGLTGCGYVIEAVAREVLDADVRHPGADFPAGGFESLTRTVVKKLEPLTLVAHDGSTCVVPRARFDRIRIGQSVICVWTTYRYRRVPGSIPLIRTSGAAPGAARHEGRVAGRPATVEALVPAA